MNNSHQQTAHLLIIEDQKYRRTLSLQLENLSIGRSPKNSIIIHSEKVSRHHATLMRRKNRHNNRETYWIVDGNINGKKSSNGIYVNGEKCSTKELKHGDLINFGCDVNATFYSMNEWSDTIIPISDYQQQEIIKKTSKFMNISEGNIEVSQPQIVNPQRTINSQVNSHDKCTIQGQNYQDTLTKLANRELFRESLSVALKNIALKKSLLAVLFLNINQFDAIIKKWGYSTGEFILQEIAQRLNASIRDSDILARWGEAQFVILFSKIKESQEIEKISQRILHDIEQTIVILDHKISLKFSQGIAIYPKDGQKLDTLLRTGEVNLLHHQQQSKSNQSLNQLIIKDEAKKILKAKTILQQAIKQEEFVIYYQPKVNIKTKKVSGIEALLRWNHPKLGIIAPNKFIPLAEQTNLMNSLDKWVLRQACLQNIAWQNLGLSPITISVNLSPEQLQDPNFAKVVFQVLEETALAPELLELEITEKAILANPKIVSKTLTNLKELGINLCLDDFGNGYSSLNHLANFPFNTMKISQSCIQELTNNETKLAVISAALNLSKNLAISSVAEGVETEQQLKILTNLDCQEIQGYLFSQPLNSEEMTHFLYLNQKDSTTNKFDNHPILCLN
ncbi:MAG TPA: diguanylate cyclase [Cyanothece sp. UBA12306]|nr:diguanylate cyclase [Cyanothece sp. UBA12306]